jgi:hypothetical protein
MEELNADLEGREGMLLVDRVLEVLDYFKPRWWWVEQPWLSRMRDCIVTLPFVCVDYCRYSDWGYRKRTRLWTNMPFEPLTCDGKGSCGNMVGKRHRVDLIEVQGAAGADRGDAQRLPGGRDRRG